eukprot:CAMPEP_0174893996 /NCGR_PEP_ID=MMETSP0167-20121228/8708_1 /TAXON_ID=38298 /ORGANISM="Rhodella maculata, Strain CCMP736" /LENGTH=33 /DNA_ID= /DNA_START= /DNA_END= /DNA_ORIENTATION=
MPPQASHAPHAPHDARHDAGHAMSAGTECSEKE